ncbi:MAG: TonB-dependent outer membrane protein SusC/RagA [Gemmatimonadetes bacterium]|nr:TonB-dependent outer membrane protein SusC/RagA [Gemmatimonadota bacterium]
MLRTGLKGLIALALVSGTALAQTGTITGRVTTSDGQQPIPRAQVTVLGVGAGAISRDDGQFTIVVRPGTYTVRASRIGFAPDSARGVIVTAGGNSNADFHLKATAVQLGTVVVGYGTQEERDKTGSIEKVTEKEFNTGRMVSPEQLIQGKVAGVQVIENNEPGGGLSIRVRGGTSVSSSNEPLFVIDNVPLQVGGGISSGRNPLNFINPDDIENITVLKDASATAIYGSRGANGVIIVTTKQGAAGSQVTYSTSISSSRVTGGPDVLSADQFRAAVTKYAPESVSLLGAGNVNYRDLVQRNGFGQDHSLAFAGGRSDMLYRFSLGYLNQEGVVQGTNVKRMSTGLHYGDQLLNKRLNISATLKGTRTEDDYTPSGVIGTATQFNPTQNPLTAAGTYYQYNNNLAPGNPLAMLAQITDKGVGYRSLGDLQAKYSFPFLAGLSGTVNGAYDVANSTRTYFAPSTERGQVTSSNGGNVSRNSPSQVNTVLEVYGNYGRDLGMYQTHVDLTAGISREDSKNDNEGFFASGLSSDLLGANGVPAAKVNSNYIYVDESKLVSQFARANFSLMDRYLVGLTVRRDGSSRFGPDNQYGVFPSAALGWRIIDEPWMKGRLNVLSDLKLRYSYGVNGNQAFGNYAAYSSYGIGDARAQVQFGNQFVTTIRPSAADPGIRWEQTTSNDFGADLGFWDNRITATVDGYNKKTKDLIFYVPVAAGTNLSNFVTTNIGSMKNTGFELGIAADIIRNSNKGFAWSGNFNASTNTNTLLHINAVGTGKEQILTGGIAGGVGSNIEVLQPGLPVNSFFVYKHIRDGSGNPIYTDTNKDGTINEQDLYVDQNNDKQINQDDRVAFHSPQPKWIFGHTSNMSWRDFDASTTLRAYTGNYVYNNVASNIGNYNALKGGFPVNLSTSVLKTNFVNPQYFSDVYVEDASFVRMDNLTLGYTLRNRYSVKQVRLFGTIQNVFTHTKYSGVDPTAGLNGIDNNIYPRSRTFVGGANFTF